MKKILTILTLTLLTASMAHARVPVSEELTESVSEKFFADGNNMQTGLGQVLKKVLGRNLTRADFEVIPLSTTTMRNPWAFAYPNDDKSACTAGDNSTEFLILLRAKTKNTAASSYVTYSFKVNAEQAMFAVHKDGIAIDNCADVAVNESLYVIAPAVNMIDGFAYVEIAEPKAQSN